MFRCQHGRRAVRSSRPTVRKDSTKRQYSAENRALQHRQFLESLASSLGNKRANNAQEPLDPLYTVTVLEYQNLPGGTSFIKQYQGSPALVAMVNFPELAWMPWRFNKSPTGFWESLSYLIEKGDAVAETFIDLYIKHLEKQLNMASPDEWREARVMQRLKPGDSLRLLKLGSLQQILKIAYPHYVWDDTTVSGTLGVHKRSYSKGHWLVKENRQAFLKELLNRFEGDWERLYSLTRTDFQKLGATGLLNFYNGSPAQALMSEFPDHNWKPWKFIKTPKNFWINLGRDFRASKPQAIALVKQYLEELAQQLSLRSLADWEYVSLFQLGSAATDHIRYLGSLQNVLRTVYPNQEWQFKGHNRREIERTFADYNQNDIDWTCPETRRRFLDNLKAQLGDTYESLYKFSVEDLVRSGGEYLYHKYNRSVARIVSIEYPEHSWNVWAFKRPPAGWHLDAINLAAAGDPVAYTHCQLCLEDYKNNDIKYHLAASVVQQLAAAIGQPLSNIQLSSTILKPAQPQPANYWKSRENRREFFEALKERAGGTYESMYGITYQAVKEAGGGSLISQYYSNVSVAIMDAYPEHLWRPWRFTKTPSYWWQDVAARFVSGDIQAESTVREYIEEIANKCKIKTLEDWLHVGLSTKDQARLSLLGGQEKVLQRLYPLHDWKSGNNSSGKTEPPLKRFLRKRLGHAFWRLPRSHWEYLEHLKSQLGNTWECMYGITFHHFYRTNGASLLATYGNYLGPDQFIMVAYPIHAWKPWCFVKMAVGFRTSVIELAKHNDPVALSVLRTIVEDIGAKYRVNCEEDWYMVPRGELEHTIVSFLKPFGMLPGTLAKLYPHHPWNEDAFGRLPGDLTKQQRTLAGRVEDILPLGPLQTALSSVVNIE